MSRRDRLQQLTTLEGRQVCVALRNGERLDDVQLVSTGRRRADSFWLFAHGMDVFIAVEDVVAVWEAPAVRRPVAA